MKRPLILFSVLVCFSVPQVFAHGEDKKQTGHETSTFFGFEMLNNVLREEVLSRLSTRDRINAGKTCKNQNLIAKELNNRVYLIDGSRKQFNDLKHKDYEQVKGFNDAFYIGKTYLDSSDTLRLWTIAKCIDGTSKINALDMVDREGQGVDEEYYLNLLAMKPLEIDENFSLQDKLRYLADYLIIEKLSAISGKEIPAKEKSIEIDAFNHNIRKLGLTESIDAGTASNVRLAHLFINQELWNRVRARVEALVGTQVGVQVGTQVRTQVVAQIEAQVGSQIEAQVGSQIEAQVWSQFGIWGGVQVSSQVSSQVEAQLEAQVGTQFWDQVWDCLSKYDFKSAYDDRKLNDALKPAINSAVISYQFAAITIQNSRNFRELRDRVSRLISETFAPEQIDAVLDAVVIPDHGDLPVVNTFLEMIRI